MNEAWPNIFYEQYIYINSNLKPLTKFPSSSRSTELKSNPPWNISQMITKTILFSKRIVISYTTKHAILLWIWWKVNGNWQNNMIRISQWRESLCRKNTSIRTKKLVQKSRTMRISVWDPHRKVNHLSKVIWDQFHQNRWASPDDDVKVSKDKNISRWVDQ